MKKWWWIPADLFNLIYVALGLAVLALLLTGCSGSFSWSLGPTPSPAQALPPTSTSLPVRSLSPDEITPQSFWTDELNPLLVGFQELQEEAENTSVGPDLEPIMLRMWDSNAELAGVEAWGVPPCAKIGVSKAIRGEVIMIETWHKIAYECEPGPVAGFCYATESDRNMKVGQALLDSGIAQIKTDCDVR